MFILRTVTVNFRNSRMPSSNIHSDGSKKIIGGKPLHFPRMPTALVVCARIGLLAMLAPGPAAAATAPGTIAVTAVVQATCLISATPIAFGTYTGAVVAVTATITVTCTTSTPYTISLSAGLGTGPTATVTTRHMMGPAAAILGYVLTSDAPHAVNWGLTPGTDTVAGTGTGIAQPITVYAQEAAAQYVTPGAYTDTVTATVTY
jgi:spore coat protein U-like protein